MRESHELSCLCNFPLVKQRRWKGHSKWQNIMYKKMHKDNERAKLFGVLSREIIMAVQEGGSDINFNPKLDSLITKAKSLNMPRDNIEKAIKNALRHSSGKHLALLMEARGPGKCGLMIDILTPNASRTKPEMRTILKKNDAMYIEDGSVAFMFDHKGVVAIEDSLSKSNEEFDENAVSKAEEIAIMVDAEEVLCGYFEDKKVFQYLCKPLEVLNLQKRIQEEYPDLSLVSADIQYLAKNLVTLTEGQMKQTDRLIEVITSHPDVINVYDNIAEYPSKTIKLISNY